MGTACFLLPIKMMCALQADLIAGEATRERFELLHSPVGPNGESGDQLTMRINCPSTLTSTGQITLEATGVRARGFEAERSALITMLEKLRTEYGIVSADYSYVVIAKQRAMYDCMQNATANLSTSYLNMVNALEDYYLAGTKCSTNLTSLLLELKESCEEKDCVSVESVLGMLKETEAKLRTEANKTSKLVSRLIQRELGPESLSRLFETSPKPMVINWDASFHMLHEVFEAAVSHVNGEVNRMTVERGEGRAYVATARVSFCPAMFCSEPSNTKKAAKAKLFFNILKYIEEVLHTRIMDVHYIYKEHVEDQIEQYEQRVELLWQCGNRIVNQAEAFSSKFLSKRIEMRRNLRETEKAAEVLEIMDTCAAELEEAARKLGAYLQAFIHHKGQAAREDIEAHISGAP